MIRFAILVAAPFILHAQQNPSTVGAKADYASVRDYFTRSAGMMPDADYSSGPTPQVRTFAQVIAHVADDQYNLCAPVRGEVRKAAYTEIENTLSAKADLVPAPRKAFAYCDAAYDAVTDADAATPVRFGKSSRPKLTMLYWNTWQTWEHYGNSLCTCG
jgi:hypothetical protein